MQGDYTSNNLDCSQKGVSRVSCKTPSRQILASPHKINKMIDLFLNIYGCVALGALIGIAILKLSGEL